MEALARGLPLFLSDIPVYREIYKDHAFFFSIDENIVEEFSRSFEQYCKKTSAEKERQRIAGHHYAQKKANSKNYISQLLAIYEI